MSGEMHQSEVTAENFPLHFAVAKEFGGDVHAFDQYLGPYVTIAEYRAVLFGTDADSRVKYSTIGNRRFFLTTDDGITACWFDEAPGEFSPSFSINDDNAVAVDRFRHMIENGGTEEPEWKLPNADRDTLEVLAASLGTFCTVEDAKLPRQEFLRMVADRINDDLPKPKGSYTFVGSVTAIVGNPTPMTVETKITVDAPSLRVAKAILRHYGMDSLRPVKA